MPYATTGRSARRRPLSRLHLARLMLELAALLLAAVISMLSRHCWRICSLRTGSLASPSSAQPVSSCLASIGLLKSGILSSSTVACWSRPLSLSHRSAHPSATTLITVPRRPSAMRSTSGAPTRRVHSEESARGWVMSSCLRRHHDPQPPSGWRRQSSRWSECSTTLRTRTATASCANASCVSDFTMPRVLLLHQRRPALVSTSQNPSSHSVALAQRLLDAPPSSTHFPNFKSNYTRFDELKVATRRNLILKVC